MAARRVKFASRSGKRLVGIVDGQGKRGVIVCTHFTGSKEIGHYYRLAKAMAGSGMCALRFDYGDCVGESEGTCDGMRLSGQVLDTISAIDHMVSMGVESIGLFGHSLGGSTAIVAAANDERVRALVTAAAMARLDEGGLFRGRADEWRRSGHITFPSWKGDISIGYGFYRDLLGYDAKAIAKDIKASFMIIHPGNDVIVPLEHARSLYGSANEPKSLKVIEGADHMFSDPSHEKELFELAIGWFDEWL
ncbi:MAG: prolyl oligopeptidase family serine peptidase [Candidatus Methanofastidiosa archaeon]|nr:prolyl oligopeptidase family serine peptidase [Candidatus Methanofastidiosa archaeon]